METSTAVVLPLDEDPETSWSMLDGKESVKRRGAGLPAVVWSLALISR